MGNPTPWRRRGSVLIFVLILMSFFIFLGGIYARHCLIEAQVTHNYIRNMKAYYLAEGGLAAALLAIQENGSLLKEGFTLEGGRGEGAFTLFPGEAAAGGRVLISRSTVQGARGEVVAEAVPGDLFHAGTLVVEDLSLLGYGGIMGGLHVNSSLTLEGAGNFITGDFSYSGPDALFHPGACLELVKAGVAATVPEDLHPFRQPHPRSLHGYNKEFYKNRGFRAFATFADYLSDDYALAEGPKKLLITGELDTREIAGDLAFHGVMAVSAPGPIHLSGFLNRGPGREGNQVFLVALKDQDITISPNPSGELEMGGSFLILNRGGDILLAGSPGFQAKGAFACHHLSLQEASILYDPEISPDLKGILSGLPLLQVRWLRNH